MARRHSICRRTDSRRDEPQRGEEDELRRAAPPLHSTGSCSMPAPPPSTGWSGWRGWPVKRRTGRRRRARTGGCGPLLQGGRDRRRWRGRDRRVGGHPRLAERRRISPLPTPDDERARRSIRARQICTAAVEGPRRRRRREGDGRSATGGGRMKMAATSSRRIRDGRTAATGGARRTQGRRAEDGGDGSMRGRGCCSPPATGSTMGQRRRRAEPRRRRREARRGHGQRGQAAASSSRIRDGRCSSPTGGRWTGRSGGRPADGRNEPRVRRGKEPRQSARTSRNGWRAAPAGRPRRAAVQGTERRRREGDDRSATGGDEDGRENQIESRWRSICARG